MTPAVLHVTDASSSGVLAAVTSLARAQSHVPGARIALAYIPRPDSPSICRIREMTGPRVRVHCWSGPRRTALLALGVRLAVRMLRQRAEVIHLHSSRSGMIGRILALFTGSRRRTLYSPHCFAFDRADIGARKRWVLAGAERLGLAAAPALLLVSRSEQDLARRTLRARRTAVLTNRIGQDVFTAGEAKAPFSSQSSAGFDGAGGVLRIVHVGRIAPQKSPGAFAAQAARRAAREMADHTVPRTCFTWIGDGQRTLLTAPDGTPAPVDITGWLGRAELIATLARADLLLFTSAGEGMPLAVLEAQALGVPILAHRVTGIRDVIRDGMTGVLVDPDADLSEALDALLEDPARRTRLAEVAQVRVRALHGPGTTARDAARAYHRLGLPEPLIPDPEGPR